MANTEKIETKNTAGSSPNSKPMSTESWGTQFAKNAISNMYLEGLSIEEASEQTGLAEEKYTKIVVTDTNSTIGNSSEPETKEVTSTDNVEDQNNPIMEFAKLIVGKKFQSDFNNSLIKPGFNTLYQVILGFLQNFYYNVYTVPNLPNNNCIIVKPETIFVKIPKCNIILPCMKSNINFSKNSKIEPTRIFLITDPLQLDGSSSNGSKLATVARVESTDNNLWKSGDIEIVPFDSNTISKNIASTWPVYQLSKYEKRIGPKIYQDLGGGDLLAFIEAGSKEAGSNLKTKIVDNILNQLAKYKLLHARYSTRTGMVNMCFNPYIVPGFPMASLEEQSSDHVSFNVYGYATTVVHSISGGAWNTTVSFNCATTDGEVRPDCFPVAEDEYLPNNISNLYGNMLGTSDCYKVSEIAGSFSELSKSSTSVTDAYKTIRRPATTIQEHFSLMGKDDVKIEYEGNVMCLRSSHFNNSIQEAVLSYSSKILNDNKHFALHTKDIR